MAGISINSGYLTENKGLAEEGDRGDCRLQANVSFLLYTVGCRVSSISGSGLWCTTREDSSGWSCDPLKCVGTGHSEPGPSLSTTNR